MKTYEQVREIFNECDNNQMRDVDIQIIETDDVNAVVKAFCQGSDVSCERLDQPDGTIVFDIIIDGLSQRISFVEIA